MALDIVATRYAQALFELAKAEGAVEETRAQVTFLGRLVADSPDLQQLLRNPDVDPPDKLGVLDRVAGGQSSALVRASLQTLMAMGRSELVPELAEALAAADDADRRRLAVTVRSAHPLPDAALERLKTRLEHRERKTIELTTELSPELIGGLHIRMEHRVIDGSIRAQLDQLRQQLLSVRVH
jgi:F-type H+-transporting ATPase subunit delta